MYKNCLVSWTLFMFRCTLMADASFCNYWTVLIVKIKCIQTKKKKKKGIVTERWSVSCILISSFLTGRGAIRHLYKLLPPSVWRGELHTTWGNVALNYCERHTAPHRRVAVLTGDTRRCARSVARGQNLKWKDSESLFMKTEKLRFWLEGRHL